MVLRINPARMPIWRNQNELQLGVGPQALRIKDLTAGQERLIKILYRGVADDFLEKIALEAGVDNLENLMSQIKPIMLRDANKPTSLSADYVEKHFAEICRAQSVHSVDGAVILESRKSSTVFIAESSSATALIGESLAKAAVGKLVFESDFTVETEAASCNLSDLTDEQIDRVDFAVLISQNAVSPAAYKNWLGRSIAHISVVFDSDGVTVSPVIEASKTPCLSCFHEGETARDDQWPAIASQLLFSSQQFDDVTARLFAASLVCQRVLQKLDSQKGFEVDESNTTGYRLSIASGKITEFNWQFDEACSCVIR